MKKWLVGLMAAGLCAASAWAASYSLVSSADALTEGNYVIVAGQGDSAMKNVPDSSQRISAEAVTVTDGIISDPDASVVWTLAKSGEGWTISSETSAGTVYAAAPSTADNKSRLLSAPDGNYTLWSITDSTDAGLIAVQSLQYSDRRLQKNNSGAFFACYKGTQKDVRFFKEDSGEFSVALDPSADFEVVEGEEASVTATAKNAQGDVTYAWTVDGVPADTHGNVLALSTDELGEHVVVCVATDGGAEDATAEATVSYTVVAAPQAYTVTVADGIENGSVAVWEGDTELVSPADVLEGTTLKVVATPATRSYKVESITVTGETSGEIALENGEFVMPAENVFVTATFAERTQTAYSLVESMDDFEAGADYLIVAVSSDYTSAMKNEYVSGSTVRIAVDETISIVDGAVETEDDSIVWRIAAGAEGKYTLYNAAAGVYVSAPSLESANEAQLVEDGSADAAQWTIAFTNGDAKATIGSIYENKSLQRNSNSSNKYFANYKGGAKPYLFKKVGTGVFSITLDPAEDFDVIQDEEASIAATPKNAVGEVTYAWTVDGVAAETDGPVLPLSTGALGEHVVVCVATDGGAEGVTAQATVSYTVVAAPALYTVTVADGIENGSVALNLDGTPIETPIELLEGTEVTVEATPDGGFALQSITVNGTPIEGNTFVVEGDSEVSATFAESSVKIATYTVVSTSAVEAHGDVPAGSEAVYASTYGTKYQLTGGNSMRLTLKGYEGATITGLTLSMHSNGRTGAGSVSAVSGEALIGSIANAPFSDASWNGSFTLNWVDIVVPVTATVVGEDVVIILDASANSLYCESFTVEYEPGSPAFSVTLDPAEDFDVIQGEEASVAATAKNAAGDVTYAWTVDGVAAETDGPVLALSTAEVGGPHEVVCVATDGGAEGVTAEASVKYTVVAAPVPYTVTIADGIENGTVALNLDGTPIETPINLLEGTEVTVEATPADGYELETITVNGTSIEGTTFVVAGDSEVSATFTEVVDYATLPFLAEDTPYSGPWKNARVVGLTIDGLDKDYSDGAAKFIASGNWMQIKFVGTPGTLTYNLKGNSTTADCVFEVQESATGAEDAWTTLASYTGENALPTTKTEFSHELSVDSQFVRFVYVSKDKGNVALYDIYISSSAFSVSFDKEDGFEVEQGTVDSITATVKNGEEPCYFMWSCEQAAALNAEDEGLDTLVIPATLEVGDYTVVLDVFDAQGETASKTISFSVVEPAARYPVTIADGILNGNVEADVEEAAEGDTVTLTATAAPGYKLGTITVTYGGETLEFASSPATFEMPAAEVLVGASFVERGDEFVKITSVEDLEEGEYVITGAAPDGEYAMLAELSDTKTVYIKQKDTPEEIEGNAIAGPEASIVWTVAKVADGWTIHNDAIGFVGYVAGDNSAGAEEEATAKSTWTISESGGLFLVQNVANTSRRLLYNVNSTRFACYATAPSSTLVPLAFYKKSGPAVFAVSVDNTGFELTQGEVATVTAAARNGAEPYSYVWTSATEVLNGIEGAELAIPDTLEPGDYSATVTATDSSVEPQTATAEVTFTVVAPLPVFTVTVADGIENGTVTVDKTEAEAGETVTVTATPDENYKLEAILVNGAPIEGNTFAIEGDSVVSATFAEIVKYPVTVDGAIEHGTIAADKAEAEAGETVTLSCESEEGWKLETYLLNGVPFEGNTFAMPEGEAVVSAVFTETVLVTYVPVESADELVAGGEYLVVAHKDDGFTSALKNENSGSRIGVDEVEIAADGSIAIDNDAIVWEIRAGAEEGEYVLYNATAGVYAAALSDGNTAQVLSDGTDPLAQWTIDLADAPAVKIASVAYPSRWLQRNSTPNNKFFAAYTGSQTTPALYKKAGFAVSLDKEDGFTVEAGTADSITATALRGTEPYSYAWTGDLEGEGAVLAIPSDLAEGEYAVTVTATDSSEPALTASKSISFTVIAPTVRYAITVAEGIVGGEVAVDKELAEAGETVTVTATPASGYELVAISVNGADIEGNTFAVEGDSVVSATFREVVDYATLPFVADQTPYSGPWQQAEVVGFTSSGLGSDYRDHSAKFDDTGDWMQIKFQGTPGSLSYGIKGNGLTETNVSTFAVLESADGETWTTVAAYASAVPEEGGESVILLGNVKLDEKYTLSEDSRFVKFSYESKGAGNVGIYDVYISEAGEPEPAVTVTGDTTLTLGGTFELALALENYSGGYAWAWEPEIVGYVDSDTATFWWTPTAVGETEVTFFAVDGSRTIAYETVTLTVAAVPAEPEVTLVDGGTTVELGDYFVLEFALSNYEGEFFWIADVGDIDEDGYFTWTPIEAGEFPVVVSAVSGEETIASTTVTLTVTGEPPAPVPAAVKEMVFDTETGTLMLRFEGDGVAVYGTDNLNGEWLPVEGAVIEGDIATVPMTVPFIRVQ